MRNFWGHEQLVELIVKSFFPLPEGILPHHHYRWPTSWTLSPSSSSSPLSSKVTLLSNSQESPGDGMSTSFANVAICSDSEVGKRCALCHQNCIPLVPVIQARRRIFLSLRSGTSPARKPVPRLEISWTHADADELAQGGLEPGPCCFDGMKHILSICTDRGVGKRCALCHQRGT